MLRWSLRPAFFVLMFIVVASCSGSGCSGCASCGMTPLPAGFPQASVIDNAGSVRVTRPGLDFLSANLGTIAGSALGTSGGVITFNVPSSSTNLTLATANICSSPSQGQCVADINVAGAQLKLDAIPAANGPNMEPAITINGTVPVKIADIPVDVLIFGIKTCTIDIGVGTGGCNGNSPNVDYAPVPVTAALPVVDETIPPRTGYSIVDSANASVNATIDTSIVQICGGLCANIANALKSTLVSQITGPLQNTLKNQLQAQLCTKANTMTTPQCPDGTAVDGGDCVFQTATSTCVPTLLGLDGHMNLGTLVAKYSPGNTAAVDLVLAANGAANPAPSCAPGQTYTNGACAADPNPPYPQHTPNGLTLSLLGGMVPNPTGSCVPIAQNPVPMGIPVPDELTTDKITPWPSGDPGPDINLAIAERYLTYDGTAAYNSGVLCLGVSTAQFQALNSGYVSAVIPSLKDLTFEPGKSSKPEAMAITTRPQKPPVIKVSNGTDIKKDPLLTITLPSFAIDFYVWSEDRFVRAFTYTADLTIPVDLDTGKSASNPNGGIVPVIGDLGAANGSVTNANLLWENPTNTAAALSSLLGGIVGQFLGKGFSPINLNSSFAKYGIALSIPAGGFRKLTKGTDNFIGLFADLTTAPTGMIRHTQAQIVGTEVHPEAMTLAGADRAKFPKLHVTLGSDQDGSGNVEYSTWIDDQSRSAWSTSRDVTIDSQYLFLQGKHTLYAVGRFVGQPQSEDDTPAAVPFIIDVLPPQVALTTQNGNLVVNAYDYVSDDSALRVRWRANNQDGTQGPWSEWQGYVGLRPIPGGDSVSLEVQVEDEMGNVSDVNGLIRGRPDPTIPSASSACGCSTPGAPSGTQGALLAGLAALGIIVLARRRSSAGPVKLVTSPLLVVGSLAALAATSQGCACGGNGNNQTTENDAGEGGTMNCGAGCVQPCGPALVQGLIGEYTSVAVASDGTIWVAGYNDADVTNGLLYGDLVVGKYDTGKMKVQWQTVDGLPPAPGDGDCAPNEPSGWRGGLTDPGPDVGLWTSIQLDANNNPMVSYYDATNSALKFASSPDGGKTWHTHTVKQAANSDIGRYSKLVVVGGKPSIAFLVVEPGTGGWSKSRVVLATGSTASPMSGSDWNMQDALVDVQTPCKAQFCTGGMVCIETSMQCQTKVSGCTPSDCGASEAGIGSTPQSCVTVDGGPSCQATITSSFIDTYPDATGDYVAMASGPHGIGLVVYDRTRGNLVGVANQGGQWTSAILDGQVGANNNPMRMDTGDVGIGASLAIDSNGDWHISYVNGWTEALEYMTVPAGNLMMPLTPEVVDDGQHLNGMAYSDGQHIVGDDSSLSVDSGGNIRIVYQDATAGTLHEAVGAPAAGNKHTWSVKAIQQTSTWFAGFFPHSVSQSQQVANWYRNTDHSMSPPVVSGDVAFVGQ